MKHTNLELFNIKLQMLLNEHNVTLTPTEKFSEHSWDSELAINIVDKRTGTKDSA